MRWSAGPAGPAWELTALPQPPIWIKGRERKGEGEERGERKGGKDPPPRVSEGPPQCLKFVEASACYSMDVERHHRLSRRANLRV